MANSTVIVVPNAWTEQYKGKARSADEVASTVSSGEFVYVNGGPGYPCRFMEALARHAPRVEGVRFGHALRRASIPLEPNPYNASLRGHLQHVSDYSYDAEIRDAINSGLATYRPNMPTEGARFLPYQLELVACSASPMDSHGYFSLGAFGGIIVDFARKARRLVLEVNPNQPRVLGNCWIHINEIEAVIEADYPLIAQARSSKEGSLRVDDADVRVAANVLDLIDDGSIIQIGGGATPNLVADKLASSGLRRLGVHSETVSDWLVDLVESGIVDNMEKVRHRGKTVFAAAMGTPRLLTFVENNPGCEVHAIAYVNDPELNRHDAKRVSVNTTLAIDLWGQCCSETFGPMHYTGTGGQWEHNRSGYLSDGGKGIVAFKSTARDGAVSRISASLPEGSAVSIGRNDIDYVVTEWGAARLKGQDTADRARALIALAHPKFRAELQAEAERRHLI
jgi:acyl-CoA hydrolase